MGIRVTDCFQGKNVSVCLKNNPCNIRLAGIFCMAF